MHIGAKATLTRRTSVAGRDLRNGGRVVPTADATRGELLVRRRFLAFVAAGAGLLTVATVGETVGPLRRFALLAPRRPDVGIQGFPVNGTAE